MDRVEKMLGTLSNALMVLAAIGILAMMLHITLDVAAKYLLNQPIVGTLEFVARYYMVGCVFLPIAYVQLKRQNLMVELFTMNMPPRTVAVLDGFVELLGVVYAGILGWLVLDQAIDQTALHEFVSLTYVDLPVWPARWFLPAGFLLMALIMLMQAFFDLRYGFTGRKRHAPAEGAAPAFE